MNLASHDANLIPSLTRAYGCRVLEAGLRVKVFVSVPRSEPLLRDLRAGAGIAAVFSRPSTHQTLQLKGSAVEILPLAPGDRGIMLAYGEAFAKEIQALGYGEDFSGAMMHPVREEALGIVFRPEALFEQTPGPPAGQQLRPSA